MLNPEQKHRFGTLDPGGSEHGLPHEGERMTGSSGMPAFLNIERFGRETPDSPAVLTPDRLLVSYRDLSERVESVTAALNAAGVSQDQAVVLVSPNGPEFLLTFLGASAIGACAPLDPSVTESDYRFLLTRLHGSALIVVGDCSPAAAQAAEELGMTVVHIGYDRGYSLSMTRVRPGAGPAWTLKSEKAQVAGASPDSACRAILLLACI